MNTLLQIQCHLDCVVNNEKVHLTKEDLALYNTKIENWFTQENKWLAVVLIDSFIGILHFVIGMIRVKKWFSIKYCHYYQYICKKSY